MGYGTRGLARVGGRRIILALGGLYVAIATASPLMHIVGERPVNDVLTIAILIGLSGLVLLTVGYRLPQTEIRPDFYPIVSKWCLGAIGVMLGVLVLVEVLSGMDDPVANILILPPLASVAGLGMGIHDGKAKTRARDAEERRQEAESYSRELERKNQKLKQYEKIVETVNDGIFVLDADGQFILVNDAYTELVGYDREDLIGTHSSFVFSDDTDVEQLSETIERDLRADTAEAKTYEATLQTATGEDIEVESTVALLSQQNSDRHARVGVVREVTERNERERLLAEQNERLESFASMLAHELRNPVMIGQIYSKQLPADTALEPVEYITNSFDRIEDMIDVMLVVARGREAVSESAPVLLADVVQAAWEQIDSEEATIEIVVDSEIEADATYIQHFFRNLLENAVEHGGDGVTVTVGELPTGFYVADDGCGIPASDRDMIFKEGYTTAAGQGGTGLGLAFVQKLADVYEWDCSITESAEGGAQFEFRNVTKLPTVSG